MLTSFPYESFQSTQTDQIELITVYAYHKLTVNNFIRIFNIKSEKVVFWAFFYTYIRKIIVSIVNNQDE